MKTPDFVGPILQREALEGFAALARLPLRDLCRPWDSLPAVPDSLLEFIASNRDPVLAWLEGCVSGKAARRRERALGFLVENLTGYLHGRNQFLSLSPGEERSLTALAGGFLAGFRDAVASARRKEALAGRLADLLASQMENLARWIRGLVPSHGGAAFVFSEPACREYSPGLQLRILGACPDRLLEPILDLGCGHKGKLAGHLRGLGKAAVGIDRRVAAKKFLSPGDWLLRPLGEGCWGTVISHMAFSTHFLHHHLRPGGQALLYARRYREILLSLKPGGSFLYAPGLPFIESLLPGGQYRLERLPVSKIPGSPMGALFKSAFGDDVLYAARVTRTEAPGSPP